MRKTRAVRWGSLALVLLAPGLIAGCRSEADRLVGAWQGTMDLTGIPQVKPGTTLRIVCNIRKNSDGTLGGTIDSPDQNATGIPIDVVTIKDGAVHLQSNKVSASFDGRISPDGSQIPGQWQQRAITLTTTLRKSP